MTFYYFTLAAQWCTLWCAAALLLCGLPEDVRQSRFRNVPRCSVTGVIVGIFPHRRLVFALLALVYLSTYLLSYAPMVDALRSGRLSSRPGMLDYYVPVQWLIDATPARVPLLRWADFWGLRDNLISDSERRLQMSHWGTTPAWLYPIGWMILGSACLFGPAWILRVTAVRFLRIAVPVK